MKTKQHLLVITSTLGALLFFLVVSLTSFSVHADTSYIYDHAGILTPSEIKGLTTKINQFISDHDTAIYICTEDSIHGSEPGSYLHDLGNELNVGNAVMILVNMEYSNPSKRNIEIQSFKSNSGGSTKAYDNLTIDRCISIYDNIKTYFSKENYAKGFEAYINYVEEYIEVPPSKNDTNYDAIYNPDGSKEDYYFETTSSSDSFFMKSWFQLIVALCIGGISVGIMAYSSGGRMTANQNTYLNPNTSRVLGSYDHYIRTQSVRTKKPSTNSSSSDSHGSSHSGGGNSSHGGGGGF